jgi:lipopolysaccharide biosynthesis glycosyltransferase
MSEPLRLFCAADRAFLRHVPVMVGSVLAHTTRPLELGIVSQGWRDADKAALRAALPGVTLHFFALGADALAGLSVKLVLSPLSYARVSMADLVDWDRFVYLDIDMIARADLGALDQVDLGDAPAAAVFHGDFLNAGLMVINARIWRQRGLAAQVLDYARNHRPKEADQEAIEALIGPELIRLDPRWNVLVDAVWGGHMLAAPGYHENARVLHFITGFKPWNMGRFLLPRAYAQEWTRHRRPNRLPVSWRYEAKTLVWQARVLMRRALGR